MADTPIGKKNTGVSGMTSKDANEMYWMVKGSLIPTGWSDTDIETMYNSYFKRMWNNNERFVYSSDAFEQAWEKATRIPFGTC